jgi:hypothetical protein
MPLPAPDLTPEQRAEILAYLAEIEPANDNSVEYPLPPENLRGTPPPAAVLNRDYVRDIARIRQRGAFRWVAPNDRVPLDERITPVMPPPILRTPRRTPRRK